MSLKSRMAKEYTPRQQKEVYALAKQVSKRSPETLRLARAAAERQARMNDADIKKGIQQVVEDTSSADD